MFSHFRSKSLDIDRKPDSKYKKVKNNAKLKTKNNYVNGLIWTIITISSGGIKAPGT